jgi:hypothetical protein
VDAEAAHVVGPEDQVGADRHLLAEEGERAAVLVACRELPLLVELAVVRQVGLGCDTEDPPPVHDDGGVQQAAPDQQRRADDEHGAELEAGLPDARERVEHRLQEDVLHEQVVDRVAAQAELGEHRDGDPVVVQLPCLVQDHRGVRGRVGDGDGDGAGRHPGEPVGVGVVEVHGSSLWMRAPGARRRTEACQWWMASSGPWAS